MLIKPFGKGYLECKTEEAFIEPYIEDNEIVKEEINKIEIKKEEIKINKIETKKEEMEEIKIKKEYKTELYFINVQNMNNLKDKEEIIQYLIFNKYFKFKIIDITKEMIYCGFKEKEEAMNFYNYYHKKPLNYKILECKIMFN